MFLFFVQDIAHNVLDGGLQLAGFQVTPTGRFWVTPEGMLTRLSHFESQANGKAMSGLDANHCVAVHSGGTCQPVRWKRIGDLSGIQGQTVRFRFHVSRAKLYSFWMSPNGTGASFGYVTAGGPGLTGSRDTIGVGRNLS
jgi:hypothetical protein